MIIQAQQLRGKPATTEKLRQGAERDPRRRSQVCLPAGELPSDRVRSGALDFVGDNK